MRKSWHQFWGLIIAGAFFAYPASARALTASELPNLTFLTSGDIPTILTHIINWMLWIAGVLAVIYLIYSGIMYITSAGNAEKATAGKNGVVYAIIGIVIILLSLVIINWVEDILKGKIPPTTTPPDTTSPPALPNTTPPTNI